MTGEPLFVAGLRDGQRAGLFSDAAVAVAAIGHPVYEWGIGQATWFDLGSVTKPLLTGSLAAQLMSSGRLSPAAPAGQFLPAFAAGDKAQVTIEHLLRHTSGLPAFREWFKAFPADIAAATELQAAAMAEPLEAAPGARTVYSDTGFIVVGAIVEALEHRSLAAAFAAGTAFGNDEGDLRMGPLDATQRAQTAATGFDPWRGRVLQGEVYDGNAALLGEHAAHAGLFGGAAAVAAHARAWLIAREQGAATVPAAVVRQFTDAPRDGRRPLAWDRIGPGPSQAGLNVSPQSFGHLGFTGTAVWADPARGAAVALLTNRVAHDAAGERFRTWRPRMYDAVWASLDAGLARPDADVGEGIRFAVR